MSEMSSTSMLKPSKFKRSRSRRSRLGGPARRTERLADKRTWHLLLTGLIVATVFVFAAIGLVSALTPDPPVVVDDSGEVVETGPVEAFAVQAADAYLRLDGNADQRDVAGADVRIAQLESVAVDPGVLGHIAPEQSGFGLIPSNVTAVSTEVLDGDRFVVTVSARIQGVAVPRWVRLAVPVTQLGESFTLSGTPVFVAGPVPFEVDAPVRPTADAALTPAITDLVTRFLGAYAASDGPAQEYMTFDNVQLGGLGGVVDLESVDEVYVPTLETPEEPRLTAVTVTWSVLPSGNQLRQTYGITVANRDGRWQVLSIAGAPPGYAVAGGGR